jgi:hypothetical protein
MIRILAALIVSAIAAKAQSTTAPSGTIVGFVTIDSGHVPARGLVDDMRMVPNDDGKQGARLAHQALTDSAGYYVLTGVPAGKQTIRFRAIGGRTKTVSVLVGAQDTTRLDVELAKGLELTRVSIMPLCFHIVGTKQTQVDCSKPVKPPQ